MTELKNFVGVLAADKILQLSHRQPPARQDGLDSPVQLTTFAKNSDLHK